MADYRQVEARRAHAAAHAPEAYARDADALRRMQACRAAGVAAPSRTLATRDTDAAESLRPRVRSRLATRMPLAYARDADALRRIQACRAAGVAAPRRKSATRMLPKNACRAAGVAAPRRKSATRMLPKNARRAAESFRASFVSMPQSRARSMVRVWLGAAPPRR